MTIGRTTWWPCDAAEHDRELNVELGDEFGPGGPHLMRVMKDIAQAQKDDGRVRTGFRILAKKTHLESPARAREIVEHAHDIGALDDLEIDHDGRRFVCRVSGWMADQARGRESIKKAAQRGKIEGGHVPQERDMSTSDGDVSGFVPSTRPDQTREITPLPPRGSSRQRDKARVDEWAKAKADELFPGEHQAWFAVRGAFAAGHEADTAIIEYVRRTAPHLIGEEAAA